MRSHFRKKFIQFGLLPFVSIVLLLCLLSSSLSQGNNSEQSGWKPASQVAPPGLLEQIVKENVQPSVSVDARNMKIWKLRPPKSKQALYLIDSRITNSGTLQDNPLCGAAGCVFLAYTQTGDRYQQVLNIYLNPLLPPDVPLIQPAAELQSGLPCLLVNQLEKQKIRASKLCLNGTTYEVVESHLLPKVYE